MADWTNPTVNSNYVTFVDEVKNRDVDAALMFDGTGTNLPNLTIRWNQSNSRFERLQDGTWQARILAVSGGGTGAATPSGARSALGLGLMAQQAPDAVSITGGSITGVSLSGTGTLSGNASTASTWQTARTLTIGATGKSVNGGAAVTWSVNEVVGFTPVQQGGGTGMGANKVYLGWTGSILRAQVDSTPFDMLHSTSGLNASNLTSGVVPTAQLQTTTTITLGGNFSGTNNLTLVKVGRLVTAHATGSLSHALDWFPSSAVGVIPAAYRPSGASASSVYSSGPQYVDSVSVNTAGTLFITHRNWAGDSVNLTNAAGPVLSWITAS